jgi:hypothetical protein
MCYLLCVVLVLQVEAIAQTDDAELEIAGMRHTLVDDHDIIVVMLMNHSSRYIVADGELTLVDVGGIERVRIPVSASPIAPREDSVLAIRIGESLAPGRYTAMLRLEDRTQDIRTVSGLRLIIVESAQAPPTPPAVPQDDPVSGFDTGDRGFPSWLVLLVGLTLTIVGLQFSRGTSISKKRSRPRQPPDVSMIRRVKVDVSPAKRPATIKPLRPPRGRRER